MVPHGVDAEFGKVRCNFLGVCVLGKIRAKGEIDAKQTKSLAPSVNKMSIDYTDSPAGRPSGQRRDIRSRGRAVKARHQKRKRLTRNPFSGNA